MIIIVLVFFLSLLYHRVNISVFHIIWIHSYFRVYCRRYESMQARTQAFFKRVVIPPMRGSGGGITPFTPVGCQKNKVYRGAEQQYFLVRTQVFIGICLMYHLGTSRVS